MYVYVEYFKTKNMSKNVKKRFSFVFHYTNNISYAYLCIFPYHITVCFLCFYFMVSFSKSRFLVLFFSLFVFLLLRLYFAVYFFVCFVISTRMCHRYICVASVMWLSHTYHSNIVNFRYTSNENIYSNHGRTIYSVFS